MRQRKLLAGALVLLALIVVVSRRGSTVPPDPAIAQRGAGPGVGSDAPRPASRLSDTELAATVDDLVSTVNPSRIENAYFPAFAKEQIGWVLNRAKVGQLALVLQSGLRQQVTLSFHIVEDRV